MWVKICGNTNLEDAALAAELGADAVGFVFAVSRRQVTAAQVAAITPHLPQAVERVGVFDTQNAEEIAQAVRVAGLTAVQLHGGLEEGLAERLKKSLAGGVRIIQTLHWTITQKTPLHPSSAAEAESAAERLANQIQRIARLGIADRILIDSRLGAATGGTGVAFDWAAARSAFASASGRVRLIVAGGLRPENVAEAIARLSPWGVDVSSGIEAAPGRKNPLRLKLFIQNARKSETA
jgi:phosphoribosylanthranilate isomerase